MFLYQIHKLTLIAQFIRDKYENGHRHISAILSRCLPLTSANSSSVYIVSQLLMSDYVFMSLRDNKSQCFLFFRDRPFHRDTFTKPWISSWLDLVGELEIYVNHFHPGGLKWNI